MQVQGVRADERQAKSTAILEEVGLKGLEDRRPAEMSGGQQQRVAVARAIVSRPALVLADEPTANLDSKTSDELMELFVELNEHHNTTFVIAHTLHLHNELHVLPCCKHRNQVVGLENESNLRQS